MCKACMKKNDLLEEGFCVWKGQIFFGNTECNTDDKTSRKNERFYKFPLGTCVGDGNYYHKLTTCNSTHVIWEEYKTDDCSGEPRYTRVKTNQCEKGLKDSYIWNTPLAADDLVPDVHCDCETAENNLSDSNSGNDL